MLWANSNGGRIIELLEQDTQITWDRVTKIYRIKEARERIRAEQDRIDEANVIVIMMGLNEIRDGDSAEIVAREYEQLVEKLSQTGKPIIMVDTPPVKNRDHKFEAEDLNEINHLLENKMRVKSVKTGEILENMPLTDIFETDGFHYDKHKKGSKTLAMKINEAVKKAKEIQAPVKNQYEQDETDEFVVSILEIEEGSRPYYIGRGGDTIRRIEEMTKTKIQVEDNQIRVRGLKPSHIKHAEKEISRVTEKLRINKTENKKIECRYYKAKGYCRDGQHCRFSHSSTRTGNRDKSRSPHRNYYNDRRAERMQSGHQSWRRNSDRE